MADPKAGNTVKLLKKVADWPDEQRVIGERLHEVVMEAVPELRPKLYYAQPGYTLGGPVLVFSRNDEGLLSFGLTEKANYSTTEPLVESAWFVSGLDATTEERIAAIVDAAAG